MMYNILAVLTEYIGIILYLQRVARKKIILDKYVIIFFFFDLISVWLSKEYGEKYVCIVLITYLIFLIYVKGCLVNEWIKAVKVWVSMLIIIPSLQLILYYGTKFILELFFDKQQMGIFINIIIALIFLFWKEDFTYFMFRMIKRIKELALIFVFCILFSYLLYLYNFKGVISTEVMFPVMGGIIGLCIILALWINAENEKKSKVKELQIYELYNKTFEGAVSAIRAKQHEFDNHINALKCLQMTIENPKELICAQNEYCDKLLRENSFNNLLKTNCEPILIGFLYSKFVNARSVGINVSQEIHSINIRSKIEIIDLIEVLGVLIDNAVEALQEDFSFEKELIVKILLEDRDKISIEVANRSKKYSNNEIEKFCVLGYSTKGENRGIGLSHVAEIVKKYKANFFIGNVSYNGENYLCFKIII